MDSRDLQGLMEAYIEVCGSVSVEEGRALGKTGRDDDNNPRGAAVRASSGRGMTMTPARGLGASKPEGDDKKRAAKQAAQAKKDRRAAAKDRAAEGEDRLSKLIRSVQNSSYEPEGEQINEISANLALTASQKADEMRRKAAVAGDKETASKKASQASRLYAGVGPRRAKERKKERVDEGMSIAMGELGEGVDLFDYLLEYLVVEGYADTNKAALVIMANMSEEWRESIVEAQEARNNPEKYEREQAKAKSKKQKAMEDPHTGINSPAFEKFMRQQMGR